MSSLGTEFKLNIHLEPIDGLSMRNYDFVAYVYASSYRKVMIPKSRMRMVDKDNYIVKIESSDALTIGVGRIMVDIEAYIPDGDFSDGLRTERVTLCTDMVIR